LSGRPRHWPTSTALPLSFTTGIRDLQKNIAAEIKRKAGILSEHPLVGRAIEGRPQYRELTLEIAKAKYVFCYILMAIALLCCACSTAARSASESRRWLPCRQRASDRSENLSASPEFLQSAPEHSGEVRFKAGARRFGIDGLGYNEQR
jgi:hypothetical protein